MGREVFRDKVVWITGGGSGIGAALAREFGSRGAKVAVSGRRRPRLEAIVQELEAAGVDAFAVCCDVTRVTDIEASVEAVVERFGGLDVAVANAGFSVGGRFEDLSASEWRRQFETNVIGAAMTLRYALPHLRKTRGRAVIMGSVTGTLGLPSNAPYCASKFAVRGMAQALGAELAGSGVSCTLLQPGFVESDIARVDNKNQLREDWKDWRPAQLMWPADRAACKMVEAVAARKREAVITGHGKIATFLAYHSPGLTQRVLARAGGKVRQKHAGVVGEGQG
ncbi:short-chain dehydrogenase [Lujinxingia litoralis]|uniref:Short-chain dehydrogenase n=1 Tax=Lujinxingia litoralis TaxID=2211119 RepID=A0A328C6W5_9DELT|nr:SDR family NAD(P)-dependent oxidoreductase [Lujinxingia litoralis]RAL23685.1 short-chain dehydrogenase [Lujinxingia litoralis]